MKKNVFFLMVIVLLFAMASCQKDQDIASTTDRLSAVSTDSSTITKDAKGMTEYVVNPKFGKPNSTYYAFKVLDVTGTTALSVKLYEKATGTITYLPMTKIGTYWTLSTKITINGWYDWRYVYSVSKTNISANSYTLCNSKNVFSATGISSISWPFGADGSSWSNRTVFNQTWRGGEEGGNGDGWGDGYHTGISEQYSDDWNRGSSADDLYAEIRSPLDGYISAYGTYPTSIGQSKYVAIVQQASDGKLYRFYVGHLDTRASNISIGHYVRAGSTKIGTLGKSGASSPHAHTNLRNTTNGANTSVMFYFNAN